MANPFYNQKLMHTLIHKGISPGDIAELFGCARATVSGYRKRWGNPPIFFAKGALNSYLLDDNNSHLDQSLKQAIREVKR